MTTTTTTTTTEPPDPQLVAARQTVLQVLTMEVPVRNREALSVTVTDALLEAGWTPPGMANPDADGETCSNPLHGTRPHRHDS